MPLPSFTGVKSIRSEPGTESASYQVSTFLFPSLSMLVVFCTKVAVLYQDFAYFFCIAWIKSSEFVILAADVAGTIASISSSVSRALRIIDFSSSDSGVQSTDFSRVLASLDKTPTKVGTLNTALASFTHQPLVRIGLFTTLSLPDYYA